MLWLLLADSAGLRASPKLPPSRHCCRWRRQARWQQGVELRPSRIKPVAFRLPGSLSDQIRA